MRMIMGQWSAQWSAWASAFVYVSYIYNINRPLITLGTTSIVKSCNHYEMAAWNVALRLDLPFISG